MSSAVLSVLLSFAFATVLGSVIAYSLQHRNWIRQQQVGIHEKKVAELQAIFSDLDTTLSKRLYWTRRLLYAVRRYDEGRLARATLEYDKAITEWNEKRSSFQIRLFAVVGEYSWQEFEHVIARSYYEIGAELETFVRQSQSTKSAYPDRRRLNELESELNALSHLVYGFSRAIHRDIKTAENAFYSLARHERLPKNQTELSLVSTWFLFKSLFVPVRQSLEEL
jgi:hypothetical protein